MLSDEQMRHGWPFSLLNDEQNSNKMRVEHQPVNQASSFFVLFCAMVPPIEVRGFVLKDHQKKTFCIWKFGKGKHLLYLALENSNRYQKTTCKSNSRKSKYIRKIKSHFYHSSSCWNSPGFFSRWLFCLKMKVIPWKSKGPTPPMPRFPPRNSRPY